MTASSKAKAISFMAMWAVVVWHCYCGSSIEKWFIPIVCYWSVPWFFLVSGFFFVGSFEKKTWRDFAIGKIRSLLVPYVAWCIFGLVVFMLFSNVQINYSAVAIFALGGSGHPVYNPPLWYIRALIIFMFIGSLAMGAIDLARIRNRLLRVIVFCALFCGGYAGMRVVSVGMGPGSSPMYFLFGVGAASIVTAKGKVEWLGRHGSIVGVIALLLAICLRIIWFLQGHSFSESGQGGVVVNNLCTIAVIVALWNLVDKCGIKQMTKNCCGVFVYLMHRPFLLCFNERVIPLFAEETAIKNIIFIMLVALYVPICLCVGKVVKKHMPSAYSLLIGGR